MSNHTTEPLCNHGIPAVLCSRMHKPTSAETPPTSEEPQFQVLDNVERLPGAYMYKNGELVKHDGTGNYAIILERWTLRECKKMGIQLPKIIEESTL